MLPLAPVQSWALLVLLALLVVLLVRYWLLLDRTLDNRQAQKQSELKEQQTHSDPTLSQSRAAYVPYDHAVDGL